MAESNTAFRLLRRQYHTPCDHERRRRPSASRVPMSSANGQAVKTPRTTVFQARNLAKVYEMGEVKVHALRGVDVDLFSGELVVLLGPSGSGKSTLLNILGGLDTATSGRVTYHDKDLTRATDRELTEYRRYHVGFVFQFYNLIPRIIYVRLKHNYVARH